MNKDPVGCEGRSQCPNATVQGLTCCLHLYICVSWNFWICWQRGVPLVLPISKLLGDRPADSECCSASSIFSNNCWTIQVFDQLCQFCQNKFVNFELYISSISSILSESRIHRERSSSGPSIQTHISKHFEDYRIPSANPSFDG